MLNNNRKFYRLPVAINMTVTEIITPNATTIENKFVLRVQDLSAGGLKFFSLVCYPIGTKLKISFKLGKQEVLYQAEVVQAQAHETTGYYIGCKFIHNTSAKEQVLIKFVTRASSRGEQGSDFYLIHPERMSCRDCLCNDCDKHFVCRPCVKLKCGKRYCLHYVQREPFKRI